MEKRKYDVILHAPIGDRPGELLLWTEGSSVKGELRILRQSTDLTGIIREDGSLEAEGELVTPMRRISYWAEGRMNECDIQMMLHAGHSIYELTGIYIKEKAGKKP